MFELLPKSKRMVASIEEWKDILGHPYYQCSNRVRIRNRFTGHIMTNVVRRDGYYYVTLAKSSKRNMSVHRIYMITWVPNPLKKPQVNHINGIKTDNRPSNMEWCTVQENRIHAVSTGLITNTTKGKRTHSKLDEIQVKTIRKCLSDGMLCSPLANYFNVSPTLISAIKRRVVWQTLS